jgi:uncharacterized membrane protein
MLSFRKTRSLVFAATAALGIAFPFLVYFGLQIVPASVLLAALLGVVALRLASGSAMHRGLAPGLWIAAAGLLAFGLVAPLVALKAYPILVSLGMAAVFAYSLFYPPCMIERFARLREPELPESATSYLCNVTRIWLGFFLLNAAISTWTASLETLELWTLYNGFISYVLIGCLFCGEFVMRRFLRPGFSRVP